MKRTLNNQAQRAGIALAVVVAFTVLGTGSALAATFTSATISIEPRGELVGGLNCSWREAELGSYTLITYACDAEAVGVLEACFYKNKLVLTSESQLSTFQDVASHEDIVFISKNNGTINGSATTEIPHSDGGGGHLCPEPLEARVVAVRWCNASLTDTTNDIVGAQVGELFQEFTSGVGTVPSCAELLAPTP